MTLRRPIKNRLEDRRLRAVLACRWLLVCALAALCALAAVPARAQEQPITLDVRAGYEGTYRVAEWFPVDVLITNNGPDVRGVLEWRFAGQLASPRSQQTIDLPRGSRKQVSMIVSSVDFARNGQVLLLEGGNVLAQEEVRLEAVELDRMIVGVVSSDPALLNSLNSIQTPNLNGVVVRHLELNQLSEQPLALQAINVLFLHDLDTGALTPGQRSAIELWVRLGGQLVVSGGANGQQAAAGVAELLPVDLGGGLGQVSLAPLAVLAPASDAEQLPEQVTVNQVQPRPNATPLFGAPAGQPLGFRQTLGQGSVAFTIFDIALLRGWPGEAELWQQAIAFGVTPSSGAIARQQRLNLLQNVLRLPSLQLPSAWTLLCLLGAYVLAVGPINYLVLRRLRRLEWAWLTLPVTVALFVIGFYVVGFGARGVQPQLLQIAIVQGFENEPRSITTAFHGLFSPQRARYTLSFAPGSLVGEVRGWDEFDGGAAVLNTETNVQIQDTLVDIASVRTIVTETTADLPVALQSSLRSEPSAVRGELRNTGTEALEDVLVVRGTSFQPLGTLTPGETAQIDFSTDTEGFPWATNVGQTELFDRQELLSYLFSSDVGRKLVEPTGTYLVGWRTVASVPVELSGAAKQSGLTLYVIKLNDAGA